MKKSPLHTNMLWEKILPKELRDRAYFASDEFAWQKIDALEVIKILRNGGFDVIGVDIWISGNSTPRMTAPFVYDWDIDRSLGVNNATDFIEEFNWSVADDRNKNEIPYFNFTVVHKITSLE